jgi:Zn-dependent protease
MDEIRLSVTQMPHTLYKNNAVLPRVHRMRAIGGPLFNVVCLILSEIVFFAVPRGSIGQELAAFSAAAHGIMLIMSLAPLPIVDGGSILKWTLVERGWSQASAEATAAKIGWSVGIVSALIGLVLIALHIWIIGGILTAGGIIVLGTAVGLVR